MTLLEDVKNHAGEHYRAVVPPVVSITKDTELLQKIARFIGEGGAPLPSPGLNLLPAPHIETVTRWPTQACVSVSAPTPDASLQRRVEELEKMMSDIQSRLSCAEQSCVGHFKELEVLRLADVKNKSMLADLEKV